MQTYCKQYLNHHVLVYAFLAVSAKMCRYSLMKLTLCNGEKENRLETTQIQHCVNPAMNNAITSKYLK
jgi:hypothetical protein